MTALELADMIRSYLAVRGTTFEFVGFDADEPGVAVVARGGDKFFVRVEVDE